MASLCATFVIITSSIFNEHFYVFSKRSTRMIQCQKYEITRSFIKVTSVDYTVSQKRKCIYFFRNRRTTGCTFNVFFGPLCSMCVMLDQSYSDENIRKCVCFQHKIHVTIVTRVNVAIKTHSAKMQQAVRSTGVYSINRGANDKCSINK